jgi:hypothetical protein
MAAAALAVAVAAAGCAQRAPPAAAELPPAARVPAGVAPWTAHLLLNEPAGAIRAVHLPSLVSTVVKAPATRVEDRASIHALSGPDREGRIAYIEDHFFVADERARRHLLKTVRIDGTQDTDLFMRPGAALWATTPAGQGEIGSHLALSASGGRVAFVSGLDPVQLPSAYLHVGHLEVWNLDTRSGGRRLAAVLDEGLAWFPDGRRLAFVRLVEPAQGPASGALPADFGRAFRSWDRVPAVFVLDIDTGAERFLATGWRPVVSADGMQVLVTDSDGNARGVDAGTGSPLALRLPGRDCRVLVAAPAPDQVLARCRPDAGQTAETTRNNSPLAGAKPLQTLSLVRSDTGARQVLLRAIDPRTAISVGPGPAVGR